MNTTSHDDLRAYVSVISVDTLRFNYTNELVEVTIKNHGKTPAHKVMIDCLFQCWVRDSLAEFEEVLNAVDSEKDEYSLAPGETYILPVRPTGNRNKMGELIHWANKADAHNARQVYGKIVYTDNRGDIHRTVFAYQWEYITGRYRRIGGLNYFDLKQ